jgi:hypothetical protein
VAPDYGRRNVKKKFSRKYLIFLSHSSRDAWLAGVVAGKLRAGNIEVWLDEMSLSGGEQVMPQIVNGIQKSHEAVVLVSNESLKSQWVSAEIGIAVALGKRITPLLNNVDHDSMAPLKGTKAYELNKFDLFLQEAKNRKQKNNIRGIV